MVKAAGVSSTLSALPPDGQGLLVAAANADSCVVLGTVPVAADGSFADAAGVCAAFTSSCRLSCMQLLMLCLLPTHPPAAVAAAVSALLPQGLHVIGSYSSTGSSSNSWQPSKLPAGTPTLTASSTGPGAPATWTVNGQQQTDGGLLAAAAAAAGAAGGAAEDVLQVAAGFVPVR